MKQITINKKEEGNKIIIDVKLPERRYSKYQIHYFSNSELNEYLKEEGILLSEYELESQTEKQLTSYSTKGLEPNLEGTWVFSKIEEKQEENLNKSKPRTYKKRRTKKTNIPLPRSCTCARTSLQTKTQ